MNDSPLEVPSVPPGNNPPPKYIRTFAGDMDAVQQGSTPDLAPLPASRATPLERIVASSPVSQTPIAASSKAPPPPTAPETPAYTAPLPEETPLKTYGNDFLERIKETKASTATLLAAEQDRAPHPVPESSSEEKRGNILLIAGGAALLLVGIAGAGYAYYGYVSSHAPIVVEAPLAAPIFVDEREEIKGSSIGLLGAIAKSAERPIKTGSIRLLYASSTVFTSLPINAPGILTRNINEEGSMAGIVSVGGVQSPFFILAVSSYSDTFSGMLSWETVMPRTLASLYPTYPIATSTSATSTLPLSYGASAFRDEVAGNHDVRVYRDANGRSVLLYGYWNETTLVIARDPAAFVEIAGRLATSRSR